MQTVVVQLLRAPAGGIRKHVLDIIDNLSDDKIKQIFITNINDSDVDLSYLKNNHNVEIHHVEIFEKPGIHDFLNLIKIFKTLRNKKVDILHGHGAKGGLYARLLSGLLGAKCIYTPHGGSLHRVHGTFKNIIYDFIEKALLPLTDIFLFESNYSADVFSKNVCDPKSKKMINYNGVDIPEIYSHHLYQKGEKIRFASFGLLRHLKGHDIFIETCRLLKDKAISFSYSIYGNGEFGPQLIDLITKHGLTNEVRILDYSGNVCKEMQSYDFIVHPSRFESFGYVPVEAMSVKVPVIVSHEGGLKEVAEDSSAYIAYENNPSTYLSIVEKIVNGDPALPSKVDNAYNRVQTLFSKKAMIKNIQKIYYEL